MTPAQIAGALNFFINVYDNLSREDSVTENLTQCVGDAQWAATIWKNWTRLESQRQIEMLGDTSEGLLTAWLEAMLSRDQEIAGEILRQLGGTSRLQVALPEKWIIRPTFRANADPARKVSLPQQKQAGVKSASKSLSPEAFEGNEGWDFGPLSVSRIIPYLCGLSRRKRRGRKLIMAKVFIDDTGNSAEEPLMYAAGWVGQVPVWDAFALDWEKTLTASTPKPIDYFKHSEARSLSGCFEGFSESEASARMLALAEVITRHKIKGVVYTVGQQQLRRMIDKCAVKKKGRAHRTLEDPFLVCMNSLIGFVLATEHENHPNDKVDFIFDGKPGSKQANQVVKMFEVCRDFGLISEPLRSIMGTASPMNDKDVLPLQAADLLAGQARVAVQSRMGIQPRPNELEPLNLMRQRPVWIAPVEDEVIRNTIAAHNLAVSTRRLELIKTQRERTTKGTPKNPNGALPY